MKNHQYVNGRLLQTNKKFAHLKESQKCKIAEWLYEEYKNKLMISGKTDKSADLAIIEAVNEKIVAAEIWIPEAEVADYFYRNKNHFSSRYERELQKTE